jgi:hypothetical protein
MFGLGLIKHMKIVSTGDNFLMIALTVALMVAIVQDVLELEEGLRKK